MSEQVLEVLMILFGRIAKQNEGVSDADREYLKAFFDKFDVKEELRAGYVSMFDNEIANGPKGEEGEKTKAQKGRFLAEFKGIAESMGDENDEFVKNNKLEVLRHVLRFVRTKDLASPSIQNIIDAAKTVFCDNKLMRCIMDVYGLTAKQGYGVSNEDREYVRNFIRSQIEDWKVEIYLTMFDIEAGVVFNEKGEVANTEGVRYDKKLTARLTVFCRNISDALDPRNDEDKRNRVELTPEQKELIKRQNAVILIRVHELLHAVKKHKALLYVKDVQRQEREEWDAKEPELLKKYAEDSKTYEEQLKAYEDGGKQGDKPKKPTKPTFKYKYSARVEELVTSKEYDWAKLSEEEKTLLAGQAYDEIIVGHISEFEIRKEEADALQSFCIEDDYLKMDHKGILVANHEEGLQYNHTINIVTGKLKGTVYFLYLASVGLYFVRYDGGQSYVNGNLLEQDRVSPFPPRSIIKTTSVTLYFFDIEGRFRGDMDFPKISYEVNNMWFKFKNGNIGLRDINIAEKEGSLVGIMGASGAGKTTLLNVLCGNEAPSEGEVLINGRNLHFPAKGQEDDLEGVIGLIPQDDLLIEELTVYQNLYYSAKLCFKNKSAKMIKEINKKYEQLEKQSKEEIVATISQWFPNERPLAIEKDESGKITKGKAELDQLRQREIDELPGKQEKEIDELVIRTLDNLGLLERKDLKVGSPLNKSISGGQRKRLNIALELIREPAILFVDEPTSGLSSGDSENVMNLLRELASKNGKLVFVVIHQPSSDIYKMFDKMYILDTGGYPVYYGDPVGAITYTKAIVGQKDADKGACEECGNVNTELVFNVLDAKVIDAWGGMSNKRKKSAKEWNDDFKAEKAKHPDPKVERIDTKLPKSLFLPNWFKQFFIYTARDFWAKISNTQYIGLNIAEAPLLGFVLAYLIRYIVDPQSDIYIFRENENVPIYIFMGTIVSIFFGLIISAEEIFKDAKLMKREKFLNLSRSAYLMSKIVILMGISAIQMILFIVVGNAVLGFKGMNFEFFMMLFAVSVSSNILGLIISSAFNSIVTIYIMIPLIMIPQMVLGGAMFTFDKLNKSIASVDKVPLIAEVVPARFAYEGLIVHQYKHNQFKKEFFDTEMRKSVADFKNVHYLPELRNVLDDVCSLVRDGNTQKESYADDLALLHNELGKEMRRNPSIDFPQYENLTVENFDANVGEATKEYISQLEAIYGEMFTQANDELDRRTQYLLDTQLETYRRLQDEYFNETVSDVVRKTLSKNKILRDGDKLIQVIDPVYLRPEPEGILTFRCHFFAPEKYFLGRYWDTLWFNILAVWGITAVLYVILYYDLARKGLDALGRINFGSIFKKKNK